MYLDVVLGLLGKLIVCPGVGRRLVPPRHFVVNDFGVIQDIMIRRIIVKFLILLAMPQDLGPQQLPTWPVLLSLYAMAILIVSKESSTSSYIKSQSFNSIRVVVSSFRAYFGQVQRSVVVDHVAMLHNDEIYKVQVSIDQF